MKRFVENGVSVVEYTLVGGRPLYLLDGFLDEAVLQPVSRFFQGQTYAFCDIDTDETAHIKHLRRDFSDAEVVENPILAATVAACSKLVRVRHGVDIRVDEAYANLSLHGDFQFSHADGDCWTGLLFTNDAWKPHWGGEFFAFDDVDEGVALALAPRPGRLLVFDGQILHRGGSPSKHCLIPRITLAIKLVPVS